MSAEGQAAEPTKRFVWWSTEESVADGVPSVLAALEVVVAVGAYWAIAIYFETTTHLWVSICMAPLLLLRSEQSIALGVRWFEFYLREDGLKQSSSRSVKILGGLATGGIASLTVSEILARQWLLGYESWGLYWRSAVVGCAAATVALAGLVAMVGQALVKGQGPALAAGTFGAGVTAALGAAAFVAGVGALVGGIGGWIGGMATAVGLFAVAKSRLSVPLVISLPGIVLGCWLRTVVIRFVAILRFLQNGFWNIPANITRTLFIIDLCYPAELVPGYRGRFPNSSAIYRRLAFSNVTPDLDLFSRLIFLIGYVTFFVPAYLYRLSIKSTCWLYLPLVYIASERDFAWTSEHLVDRLVRGGWEWWRRILAVSTLIAFAVTTLASISAHELRDLTHEVVSPKVISPIEFMFHFDFSGRWWQYCSIAGALITGWLFLQAKDIQVDLSHAKEAQALAAVNWQVDRVKLMMRVRNVLSVALIAMVGVHGLLAYSPVARYLPAYILRGLGWFYGTYMPPIPAA